MWCPRGICRSNGLFFFLQEILKHGSNFLIEPKFLGFHENPENRKICENGPIFQEKSVTMSILFCQNDPKDT